MRIVIKEHELSDRTKWNLIIKDFGDVVMVLECVSQESAHKLEQALREHTANFD